MRCAAGFLSVDFDVRVSMGTRSHAFRSWLFGRECVIWKRRQLRSPYAKLQDSTGNLLSPSEGHPHEIF